jgi:hypothetical protein
MNVEIIPKKNPGELSEYKKQIYAAVMEIQRIIFMKHLSCRVKIPIVNEDQSLRERTEGWLGVSNVIQLTLGDSYDDLKADFFLDEPQSKRIIHRRKKIEVFKIRNTTFSYESGIPVISTSTLLDNSRLNPLTDEDTTGKQMSLDALALVRNSLIPYARHSSNVISSA